MITGVPWAPYGEEYPTLEQLVMMDILTGACTLEEGRARIYGDYLPPGGRAYVTYQFTSTEGMGLL